MDQNSKTLCIDLAREKHPFLATFSAHPDLQEMGPILCCHANKRAPARACAKEPQQRNQFRAVYQLLHYMLA
jgi:hypothetical protein